MTNRNKQKAEGKQITTAQAKKLLERQVAERVEAVNVGIQELLQKHNCSIDLQMTFSSSKGMLGGRLVIVPMPEREAE